MCRLCRADSISDEDAKKVLKLKVCKKCRRKKIKYLSLFTNLISLTFLDDDNQSRALIGVKKLQYLRFPHHNDIKRIPGYLTELKLLDINSHIIKKLPLTLTNLRVLILNNIYEIEKIPKEYVNLRELRINERYYQNDCKLTSIPQTLTKLKILSLNYLNNLIKIPHKLPRLNDLRMDNCPLISDIPIAKNLKNIIIIECNNLSCINFISIMLEDAFILNCQNLLVITSVVNDKNLTYHQCPKLVYPTNKLLIDKLIKQTNKIIKYRRFIKWTKMKEFAEYYYNPEHNIGKMIKRRMYNEINNILRT